MILLCYISPMLTLGRLYHLQSGVHRSIATNMRCVVEERCVWIEKFRGLWTVAWQVNARDLYISFSPFKFRTLSDIPTCAYGYVTRQSCS